MYISEIVWHFSYGVLVCGTQSNLNIKHIYTFINKQLSDYFNQTPSTCYKDMYSMRLSRILKNNHQFQHFSLMLSLKSLTLSIKYFFLIK